MRYTISVIVPIYNVSSFIKRCAESLLNQTLSNVEFVFVDDCSPDNSVALLLEVIQKYSHKSDSVKLIRHDVNMGLPAARNSGLKHASGEYIFHCDSDDWLENNALELLHNKAVCEQAEIVYSDWYLSFGKSNRYMSQSYGSKNGVSSGLDVIKLMLGGRLKFNVWNKLVKRDLYLENGILFPDGFGMGEDMTMIKLFSFTDQVAYLNKAIYYYSQMNTEAFTKRTTERNYEEIKYNVANVIGFIRGIYGSQLEDDIHFFKLNVKFPFLISSESKSYERWNEWYKESNNYIDKNPMFSKRSRLLQKAALARQYWLLKIYYSLVIRFVYGVLFK